MIKLPEKKKIQWWVKLGLQEDLGEGDITSDNLSLKGHTKEASLIAKEPLTLCGLDIAKEVFLNLDADTSYLDFFRDGQQVPAGAILLNVKADGLALLEGERTALNILQRLSGIATLTRQFVNRAKTVTIMDTRKTTPGLRVFEKYAVTCGGGTNHRLGLFDAVLIKDNHIIAAGGISQAVKRIREKLPQQKIEVEAASLEDVRQAVRENVDIILLDNMNLETIRQAVGLAGNQTQLEVSGSVSLEKLDEIVATGIDFISVGALTHSARAVDISMDFNS